MAHPLPSIPRYLDDKGREPGRDGPGFSKTTRSVNRAWNLPFPFTITFYRTAEVHDYGRGIKKERYTYLVSNLFDYRYIDFASPKDGQLWPLSYTTRKNAPPLQGVLWPRGDKVK